MFTILRAIVMSLAFVVFLPFAGFLVVGMVLVERCRGLLKESPPTVGKSD